MDTSSFVNAAYHGGVVGIINAIYSMAARNVFKLKPADLGKLDVEDSLKLTATVGCALMTQVWLVTHSENDKRERSPTKPELYSSSGFVVFAS